MEHEINKRKRNGEQRFERKEFTVSSKDIIIIESLVSSNEEDLAFIDSQIQNCFTGEFFYPFSFTAKPVISSRH